MKLREKTIRERSYTASKYRPRELREMPLHDRLEISVKIAEELGRDKAVKKLRERLKLHTRFVEAVCNGEMEKCEDLLNKGADVNSRDEYGATALILAYRSNHIEIARILVEKYKADVNARLPDGDSFFSVSLGRTCYVGESVLDILSMRGDLPNEVEFLIKHGARIHFALEELVLKTHTDFPERTRTAEILIKNGADVNARLGYRREESILTHLSEIGSIELVELLLNHGAYVNEDWGFGGFEFKCYPSEYSTGYSTWSPALEAASKAGHTDIVKLLQEHGARKIPNW